jgi:hypothetical protein
LFAAYPHAQATVETIAVYDRLLADIPATDLQVVVEQAIAECKFVPTVAEIREKWLALASAANPHSSGEGWAELQKQILRTGHSGVPHFSDAITAQVVKQMGWRELCLSENQVADRAHFLRLYEEVVKQKAEVKRLLPQARQLVSQQGERGLPGNPTPALPKQGGSRDFVEEW